MKILCAGGGTLGSVTPLLAVIEFLKSRYPECVVEWWGTEDGPERNIVEAAGINFKTLSAGKLRRYFSWQNIFDLFKILIGFCQAVWYLGSSKPDCLLTAGSYVAVPIAWAAYLYGVPVLAHQQDFEKSLANKLIAPVAKKISVTLPESLQDFPKLKTVLTGNPVRSVFFNPPAKEIAREKIGLDRDKQTLLVMGGGTGAKFLNDLVVSLKEELLKNYQIIHVTGAGKMINTSTVGYKAIPFTTDSINIIAAADVVITRAGMGSLSELSALKKPSIVIPIPDSHQEANAKYFADRQAVIRLDQKELISDNLLVNVSRLMADKKMQYDLGYKLNSVLLTTSAAERMADMVQSIINAK